MAKAQDLIQRALALYAKRDPWMAYWQELTDVLLPTRADFTTTVMPGEARGRDIYDGTPRRALRDLASALDGLLKPKTANWFHVTISDEDLAEVDGVKRWLEVVREKMWTAIYRKDARFIQRSSEVDQFLACLGWGVLWIGQNRRRDGLLFRAFHNNQAAVDENDEGTIDTLAVREFLTPRQAVASYARTGKDPSHQIEEAARDPKKANDKFPFVQLVLPREDRDASKMDAGNMPYASALLDIKGEAIVGETGFLEFPAAVPRWDTVPGEVYARSPGMMALPDSQTLQAMGKTLLVGGQRAVDPPIWVLNDSVLSPLRTFPGGVTVLDTSDIGEQSPVGAFPVSTNLPLGREMQQDYRAMVEAAFFKNAFNLPIDGPQMTAFEVAARKEEFIRTLGPVFGRLEADYIGHIVERVFGIMERAGAFPERPEELQDAQITFRFQSPIQQARKQLEILSVTNALQQIAPLAEAQPEILDNFDGDEIARDAPEWSGMPLKWLRTKEGVEQRRQARTQESADATALAAAQPVSQALQNVAKANSLMVQ